MDNNYEVAFSELIEMISQNRDDFVQRCESFNKAAGPVISLGDTQFNSYESMVGANERKAVRIIEQLAVSLFQARSYDGFSLYPIDPKYCRMELREQEKCAHFK